MMPGLDGPGLYEELRASHVSLVDRLVFITSGAFTQRAQTFVATARPLVLDKPISADLLCSIVEHVAIHGRGS